MLDLFLVGMESVSVSASGIGVRTLLGQDVLVVGQGVDPGALVQLIIQFFCGGFEDIPAVLRVVDDILGGQFSGLQEAADNGPGARDRSAWPAERQNATAWPMSMSRASVLVDIGKSN